MVSSVVPLQSTERFSINSAFFVGGLHIEKSFLAVIGSWLEGSGWDEALVKSGITTPGRSEGILKSTHIKRARYAHEMSLMALNIVLFDQFNFESDGQSYTEWMQNKRRASPQFQYWITVMELEAMLLQFVRCLRSAEFDDYIEIMEQMCPWYLATDHTHYGRWLPIFVSDLKRLRDNHPEVHQQFLRGHFIEKATEIFPA